MGCGFIKNSVLEKKKLNLLLEQTRTRDSDPRLTSELEDTQQSLGLIQLGTSERPNSSATPTVSITSLMTHESGYEIRPVSKFEFPRPDRDWLCLNLALSLLHMSSGDWRRATWYSDNPDTETGIFFLRDPSTQEIVDKTRPYLSWRLQNTRKKYCDQKPIKGLQCDPQLLDFARLLIEIHNWKKLPIMPEIESERVRTELHCKLSKEQLRLGLLRYIGKNFNPGPDFEFISALTACLSNAGRIEAAAEDKPERIQAYVYENIVKPLHRYLGSPELPKSALIAMPSSAPAPAPSNNSDNLEKSLSDYDLSISYLEPQDRRSVLWSFNPLREKFCGFTDT